VLNEAMDQKEHVQPWYVLSAQYTKTQVLSRLGRFEDAIEVCDQCIDIAKVASLSTWVNAFRIGKCNALIRLGHNPAAIELPLNERHLDWPLATTGAFYSLLGGALHASKNEARSAAHRRRAWSILRASGDLPSDRETDLPSVVSDASPSHTDLDAAVALLDLAGHPHILGREAFALVADTGCAEAAALLAVGLTGTRVIASLAWSDEEARTAAGHADRVPLGSYRDEAWTLLVRPRADLDNRCTLAAIRKLLATAVDLDRYRREEKQRAALWPAEALDGDPDSIWASEQAAELLSTARRIANAPLPVLLTGETGTGKELLARAIHRASDRAARPLVPFNCSAVPRDMLESQLFGYRKGAFTGADTSFPGVIRSASGGTLFLDEIADVGLDLQPKLLRFLEHKEVHPLGEPQPVPVDVRIIAATNANLDRLVAEGRFREDLYYRLNAIHLRLPPLRERREEIPTLVQHYIRRAADEQKKARLTLSDETLEYLLLYAWPGNIRQLANEVRRMVALAEPDSTLTPALLSPAILASRRTIPAAPGDEPNLKLPLDLPLPAAVEMLEQTLVRRALERSHGRVEEASRLLGISRKGLFLKRRRWGLARAS
ncbi:MAG TPA: sigma-54 dependent transcriptional regulator, partial [Vicinamibacterales bacterium]|nr:sigma-54 dependent transcriptional regulator [Vicinamibacterales bacterium]